MKYDMWHMVKNYFKPLDDLKDEFIDLEIREVI
jgi:hypothetical protein